MIDTFTSVIYIVFFCFVYFSIFTLDKMNVKRKQYCITIGILLFFGLAFRSFDQGLNDTREVYKGMFEIVTSSNWSSLKGSIIAEYTSPLFIGIMKAISFLGFNSFRIYIIVMSAIFVFAFERLLLNHCHNKMIAHLMFVAFIYPFGFYLIRQCFSMSLMAFAINSFLSNFNKKNWWKKYSGFIFWSVLSVFIHSIAIVPIGVVIVFFMIFRYFKIDKQIVYIFMIGITLALILMPKSFLFLLDYLPVGSKYSNLYALNLYTTEGNVWIAPLLVNTLIAAYLIFRYSKSSTVINDVLVACSLAVVLFVASTTIVEDMVRISYYFCIPQLLITSNSFVKQSTLEKKRIKNQNYFYLGITALAIMYSVVIALPNNHIIF